MSDRAPKPKDSIEALRELAGSGSDTSARSESVSDAAGGQRNTRNDPPATVPPTRAFEAAVDAAYRARDALRKFANSSIARPLDDWHEQARAELVRLYDEALAQRDQRDNEVVARLRRQIHEAEVHDVAVFGAQSNAELAEALRSTMSWIPTALHALLHSAAARLAAPPPGESVELEVQWRTLIDGKLYPIVTLPDGWTGRVRVTRIEEEK
ncbi:MAG: hypothetical protein A4C66_04145 [Nitrospira sp. HN-bin3]|uniref:hypothetical protein n=1 Tax=Nitrospira cf. moscoviensis SBR1015 TaxID=96242 RepID=UPI000A09D9DD|nr:hypothetical protein [Nitrospira cf. moscoviensis SBR1015]OQW33323.1 MAG: hypothetical protein A4C66_04145 [Nitrospira sp. HN-bin3]